MKCEGCQKMFRLTELRFVPDGLVPGTQAMKRNRAFCKDCGLPTLRQKEDEQPEKEYPF